MKSELQIRTEKAAQRFRASGRKPIVIEFAGLPKAGKTTCLNQVQAFLKRCGFRAEVVIERASVCPIRDKKNYNFNIWTACTTLSQILEKTQSPPRADDPDILILDRGLFDAICWLTMMEGLARLRKREREIIERFLLIEDWRKRLSGVVLMTADPEDSLEREKGYLMVEAEGSIMNVEVLQQMKDIIDETANRLKEKFQLFQVNTSSAELKDNPKKTCEVVADIVVNWIEEHLQEDILSLPKAALIKIFDGKQCLEVSGAKKLADAFTKSGDFRPRTKVEEDALRVQALPVVVVRNRSGDVLRLRRRESFEENPLHQKVVIWAGGHVRKEDDLNGSALLLCACRELQEELRLSIEPEKLELLGAVYIDSGGQTSKHAAVVYEWRAKTDDVAVALSSAEFFERRGTSLSGKFINLENLAQEVESGKLSEPWSIEIIRSLLAKDFDFSQGLFDQ